MTLVTSQQTTGDLAAEIRCRRGTNDASTVAEVITHNAYLKDFLWPFLEEGGLVVDVGANIGAFSALAARMLKPARVISFEPEPANYAQLCWNIYRTQLQHLVTTCQCGLWDSECDLPLYLTRHNMGGHTVFLDKCHSEGETNPSIEQIHLRTLDSVLGSLVLDGKPIMVIKCDCEGAEARVLAGASLALANTAIVLGEIHERACSPSEVIEQLPGFSVVIGEQFGEPGAELRFFWAVNKRFWHTNHADMERFLVRAKEADVSDHGPWQQITALRSSFSWRVTGPLRSAANLFYPLLRLWEPWR